MKQERFMIMFLPPPKLTITNNADVSSLITYYSKGFISLDELSRLFNSVIKWDYRELTDDPTTWQGMNTWGKVFLAVQSGTLSHEDYMFLAVEYENYMDRKARGDDE